MNEKETKLIIAAILHDIGKVIYREGNDVRKHSISGYDYLKDTGITDKEILDAVKYHHAQSLKNADIEDNSLSYIVYMADNIASATDRRERMEEEKVIYMEDKLLYERDINEGMKVVIDQDGRLQKAEDQ